MTYEQIKSIFMTGDDTYNLEPGEQMYISIKDTFYVKFGTTNDILKGTM